MPEARRDNSPGWSRTLTRSGRARRNPGLAAIDHPSPGGTTEVLAAFRHGIPESTRLRNYQSARAGPICVSRIPKATRTVPPSWGYPRCIERPARTLLRSLSSGVAHISGPKKASMVAQVCGAKRSIPGAFCLWPGGAHVRQPTACPSSSFGFALPPGPRLSFVRSPQNGAGRSCCGGVSELPRRAPSASLTWATFLRLFGGPSRWCETFGVGRGIVRMPHGLKRYHRSKQSHFITFTCYRRLRNLATPEARDIVVVALHPGTRKDGAWRGPRWSTRACAIASASTGSS